MKECLIDSQRTIIAHDQAPIIPQPTDGALDNPAAPIPPQRATVLRRRSDAIRFVRTDQFGPRRRRGSIRPKAGLTTGCSSDSQR
jgi:hypothetical protein